MEKDTSRHRLSTWRLMNRMCSTSFQQPRAALSARSGKKYSTVLSSIAESCFELDVFRSIKAIKILKYAQENFAEYPEFLWKRYPEYAVLRRKDTGKWYGLLMRIKKDKLKLKEQGPLEILVIRSNPADVDRIIDGKKYFPAYHMNKKNWLTVSLESSVPDKQILAMLLASRGLANK